MVTTITVLDLPQPLLKRHPLTVWTGGEVAVGQGMVECGVIERELIKKAVYPAKPDLVASA